LSANRISFQPDYLFSMVVLPDDWNPRSVYDVPPRGILVSRVPVASFEEALHDLIRSNKISLQRGLREWAVIQTAEVDAS
jgi:hypothetical protein